MAIEIKPMETEEEMRGMKILVYNMGYATFLCDPKQSEE